MHLLHARPLLLTSLLVSAVLPVATSAAPTGGTTSSQREDSREEAELLLERMRWFREGRAGPDGLIPSDARFRAFEQLRSNLATGKLTEYRRAVGGTYWAPLGPSPLFDGSIAYSGRVTAFAAHPTQPATLYLGSAQGGVWKTVDSGINWQPLTDSQESLSIGSIALAPSNPQIVYAGTGEANFSCDSYFGAGILKSIDGGATWTLVGGSTFKGTSIAKIVVHPADASIVWAINGPGTAGFTCTSPSGPYGVWKSTDGGVNWTQVLFGDWGFGGHDLIISPTDPQRLYAGLYLSGVWMTTNGGNDWTKLGGGLPTSGINRVDLAIDPHDASVVYAVFGVGNSPFHGIFRSSNGGATWSPLPTVSGSCEYWDLDGLCSYAGSGVGNCWYNLVIEVAPDGRVWVGGLGVWQSSNGGTSWTDVCPSEMHVDQHAIAFTSDGRTWVGNDGGAFLTADAGGTWLNRNPGLALTQFYPGAALHPTKAELMLGGAQDNGALKRTGGSSWSMQVPVGDGAFNAIDSTNPDTTWYISHQQLDIWKTTNGGASFFPVTSGIDRSGAAFIAPFAMCPGDPLVLIAGTGSVWKTTDGATSWSLNGTNPIIESMSVRAVAFAPSVTSCSTYFAGVDHFLYRTTSGGASWTNISPGGLCQVADLAVDPSNANAVYVACGGFGGHHLYRTTNALAVSPSWTSVDAGLPDTPFNAVLVDPDSSNVVYVGTDLGVFRSVDVAATWTYFMDGHPKTAVFDLVADSSTQTLVSFTHGRGAFRLTAANPKEASPAGTMTVQRGPGTSVLVTYDPACGATDHAIYWGATPISGSMNWTTVACALGATGSATFDPGTPASGQAFYFVVVGQNGMKEGSYGRTSSAVERPEASGFGACDLPRDLTGACP